MTTPLPAARPLGLDDDGRALRGAPSRRSKVSRVNVRVGRGGNAVALQEFLGVGLGAFELRGGLARPEAAQPRGRERIDHAERPAAPSGPMMVRPTLFGFRQAQRGRRCPRPRRRRCARGFGGGAAIAGRDQHFGDLRRLRALPRERMFAPAGTHDQDLHGARLSAGSGACR